MSIGRYIDRNMGGEKKRKKEKEEEKEGENKR